MTFRARPPGIRARLAAPGVLFDMGVNMRATENWATDASNEIWGENIPFPVARSTADGSTANVGFTVAPIGIVDRGSVTFRNLRGFAYNYPAHRIEPTSVSMASQIYRIYYAFGDSTDFSESRYLLYEVNGTGTRTLIEDVFLPDATAAQWAAADEAVYDEAGWIATGQSAFRQFTSAPDTVAIEIEGAIQAPTGRTRLSFWRLQIVPPGQQIRIAQSGETRIVESDETRVGEGHVNP